MNERVSFEDLGLSFRFIEGETIGKLAVRCGIFLDQPCGGQGLCKKCGVFANGEYVLACRTEAKPGMSIKFIGNDDHLKTIEATKSIDPAISDSSQSLGVAVDIGTTTLVVYLLDLKSGSLLAVSSAANPQISLGADVISRISYICENRDGLHALRGLLIDKLNAMFANLTQKAGTNSIEKIVVAGNTTMEHIFAGISPESIGEFPFRPQFYDAMERSAADWELSVNPGATVKLLPNISGFVGGDIVAGILYSQMTENRQLSLLVDIGTNNEMALGNGDFLLCCSAAAGPALEGAKISCGMRAASGAIEKVKIEGDSIATATIEGEPPKGLCGSGLVDAVAELLSNGIIEKNGRFAKRSAIHSACLSERLTGRRTAEISFVLAEAGERGSSEAITLTQKDIREVQLAKGAIATGIEIMLSEAGVSLEEIDNLFIAGAFGNYLNFRNAKKIGILPDIPMKKITPLGNSAGLGACRLLHRKELWERAANIRTMARHIELASHACFQDIFVRNLSF